MAGTDAATDGPIVGQGFFIVIYPPFRSLFSLTIQADSVRSHIDHIRCGLFTLHRVLYRRDYIAVYRIGNLTTFSATRIRHAFTTFNVGMLVMSLTHTTLTTPARFFLYLWLYGISVCNTRTSFFVYRDIHGLPYKRRFIQILTRVNGRGLSLPHTMTLRIATPPVYVSFTGVVVRRDGGIGVQTIHGLRTFGRRDCHRGRGRFCYYPVYLATCFEAAVCKY